MPRDRPAQVNAWTVQRHPDIHIHARHCIQETRPPCAGVASPYRRHPIGRSLLLHEEDCAAENTNNFRYIRSTYLGPAGGFHSRRDARLIVPRGLGSPEHLDMDPRELSPNDLVTDSCIDRIGNAGLGV